MAAFYLKATAFAAVCILLSTQASGYTMGDMCAQWSGEGYVGNPADCTGWGYCRSQKLVSWGNCGKNLVFDSQTGTCQQNTKMACSTNIKQTCDVLTSPAFMADPSDCSKYAYCWGNGTVTSKSCPKGQTYAANNNTCVWGPSCSQTSICRFMLNNIYVGDPNNCGQYLQCLKGAGVWGKCQGGKYYNAAAGVCQTVNPCDGSVPSPNDSPTPPVPKDINCSSGKLFYPDNSTCYGYFYCKEKTSKPVWGSCPYGLEFDKTSSKCVQPATIECGLNRCANTNLTYAAVANTNCTHYYYCPDNSEGQCPPSFPYFDEINGKCVTEKPEYTICNGKSTQ